MRRRLEGTEEKGDPWWARDLEQCVTAYRTWIRRQEFGAPPRFAERYRAMCIRRHGVDPATMDDPR